MKLTAESLDELYAEAEKEGDVDVRRIVETVERVEKDFTRSADAAKRGEARVDALVDKAIGKVTPTEVEPLPLPPVSPKTPTQALLCGASLHYQTTPSWPRSPMLSRRRRVLS